MAVYPGAVWQPLPENSTQGRINPTQFIIHTAVDAPGRSNVPAYFARADITVESHFWIYLDGTIVQMMDTNVRADANRYANSRAISVETEDEGNPEANPWTEAQKASLVKLIKWANETHGIPMTLCTSDTTPGLGWHSMWGFLDPINQTGAINNPWSTSLGKTCPGKTRISQIINEIIPALAVNSSKVGYNMTKTEAQKLVDALYSAILHREGDTAGRNYWVGLLETGTSKDDFLWSFLINASNEVGNLQGRIDALEKAVAALTSKVSAVGTMANHTHADLAGPSVTEVIGEIMTRLGKSA